MKKSKELKKLTDRRAYKLLTTIDQDPYVEEFWRIHVSGDRRNINWGTQRGRKKQIYRFEYRKYRSWKYNRKNKYK